MSEFAVAKNKLDVRITLTNGTPINGALFVALQGTTPQDPVKQLLEDKTPFIPFLPKRSKKVKLIALSHIACVAQPDGGEEERLLRSGVEPIRCTLVAEGATLRDVAFYPRKGREARRLVDWLNQTDTFLLGYRSHKKLWIRRDGVLTAHESGANEKA